MKNKWVLIISAMVALSAMPYSHSAGDEPDSSQVAIATPIEIKRTAGSLDELLNPTAKKVVFDGTGHSYKVKAKPVDPKSFIPVLADLVKSDRQTVSKALSQRYHLSDIVFAGLIAGQNGQTFKQALGQKSTEQWINDLKKANISLQEAQDQLDIAYVELAFVALDRFDEGRVVQALPKE
ncbi:MAG: hypothetical protein JWM99_5204 [Verrucomicrobiales bacterium]|nr:hypothetical protein [Verrucomicrobiales bacterium]